MPERSSIIGNLARTLKEQYDTTQMDSLKQIASDSKIIVIESPKVFQPSAVYYYDLEQQVIFTRRPRNPLLRLHYLGHELGHHLLKHTGPKALDQTVQDREVEAEFFATSLIGQPYPVLASYQDTIERLVREPISTVQAVYSDKSREAVENQLLGEYLKNQDN